MATYLEVREGLARAIELGVGLAAYPRGERYQSASPPCALILRAETDHRLTFSDTRTHGFFKVQVVERANDADSAIDALDEYAAPTGSRSITAAVADGDNWTDNLVDYAQVQLVGPILEATPAGGQETYLMIEFDVEVVW